MNTATLVLQINSDGVAKASERLKRLAEVDAKQAESARDRLAAVTEKAADREWQAYLKSEAKAAAERAKGTASAEREYEKRRKAYERQWFAAENAYKKGADAAEKAAKREAEAWNNAIQKTKARLEREGIGRDGVLPIRPSLQRIESGINSRLDAMAGAAMVAGGALVSGLAVHTVIAATKEYEKLLLVLEGATGSSEKAKAAFAELESMQASDLFGEDKMIDAFVKLRDAGLDPTARSLKAYADLAVAKGKDLGEVSEAIVMASMGSTRALRGLQIGMKADGDKLNMTFRGVTTTIENSATAIEQYVVKLSETNFAGSVARQMEGLTGSIAGLKDAWGDLGREIGQSGVAQALIDITKAATAAVKAVNDLTGGAKPSGRNTDHNRAGLALDEYWTSGGIRMKYTAEQMKQFQAEIQSSMGQFLAGKAQQEAEASANATSALSTEEQKRREIQAGHYRDQIDDLRKHLRTKAEIAEEEFQKERALILRGSSSAAEAETLLRAAEAKRSRDSKDTDAIAAINAAAAAAKAKAAEAKREFEQFQRAVAESDPFAKAYIDAEKRQKSIDKYTKAGTLKRQELTLANEQQRNLDVSKAAEAMDAEYRNLQKSLKNEESAVEESYRERKKIIDENAPTEEQRSRETAIIKRELGKQLSSIREARIQESQALMGYGAKPEDKLRWGYEAQLRKIAGYQGTVDPSDPFASGPDAEKLREAAAREYANQRQAMAASRYFERAGLLTDKNDELVQLAIEEGKRLQEVEEAKNRGLFDTEREYLEARNRVREEYDQKSRESQLKIAEDTVSSAEQMFGHLANAAKNWGGEQSEAYRQMMAVQKAFAIAASTLNMFHSISNASTLPYPANIAAMASAAAQGALLISQVSSAGNFDSGGDIASGQFGWVGERGRPEIVSRPTLVAGPAHVTGSSETARILGGGGGSTQLNVRIVDARSDDPGARGSARDEKAIFLATKRNPRLMRAMVGR